VPYVWCVSGLPLEGAEYRDALSGGQVRGRGAGMNPGNRFETVRLHVLGEHLDDVAAERPDGTQVITRIFDDATQTIVNKVDSPDISFNWTVNPYRGCEHGCIYCYARPSHELLGLSSGLDFETRIAAKREAPALLRAFLSSPKWEREPIVMSGITDPYQPIESRLRITRGCLEAMVEYGQPVSIITKNRLITRDLDLLGQLHQSGSVSCAVSITTLDAGLAGRMEPRASSPAARLETVRMLASAGIPVHVMVAPIIPALNDHEVPAILEAAAEAGASGAGYVMLRLPHQIKALFLDWLERTVPERAAHVESQLREMRGGELYQSSWFTRQRGEGARAEQISQAFEVFTRRFGLDRPRAVLKPGPVRAGISDGRGQLSLF
jgi:DNA repair photolyase